MSTLEKLTQEIVAFRDERDWEQFHAPNQLATALSIEVAELQEIFLWKDDDEADAALRSNETQAEVKKEIADVLIYALLFCDAIGESPASLIRSKLNENADKYPSDQARGKADKYTSYRTNDS